MTARETLEQPFHHGEARFDLAVQKAVKEDHLAPRCIGLPSRTLGDRAVLGTIAAADAPVERSLPTTQAPEEGAPYVSPEEHSEGGLR